MFLRFVITQVDEDSRHPQGLVAAAYELLNSGSLNSIEWTRIREILDWFDQHLPAPPEEFSAGRAIFWFKSRKRKARESMQRMWELVYLIREHGYHVEVHKCRTLANICYEDEIQVAAYPSARDSRTIMS